MAARIAERMRRGNAEVRCGTRSMETKLQRRIQHDRAGHRDREDDRGAAPIANPKDYKGGYQQACQDGYRSQICEEPHDRS